MPFELFVALRFLREGRFQTLLILLGVSVGVAVIVFLAALINGLQTSLLDKTLGSQAHVTVRPNEEAARRLTPDGVVAVAARVERSAQRLKSIEQWQQVLAQLERVPGVRAVSPTVAGSAFAVRGAASRSVAVRGVDPVRFEAVIRIRDRISSGQYRLQGTDVVIGTELARDLGVAVNDRLRLTTPEGRSELFTVVGIFDLGNRDVNERWVLVPLRAAQTLLDLAGGVSTIEVKVSEIFSADAVAQAIAARTGLVADSWMKLNSQMLIGLKSQDSSKSMIQFFVVVAVALGIASVLVVSVVQKSREIGILKAMGASTARVMRVFLIQGALVGLVGAAAGSLLGAGLSLFFASMARNPDGSPIFPVDLSPTIFLGAAGVALFTGLVAAVAPARRAARLDPAVVIAMAEEVLRLEGVVKDYGEAVVTRVLHEVSFTLEAGELTALVGPSGSGKSTLLNLIGLLDRPTAGKVFVQRQDTSSLDDDALTRFRALSLGFIFQFHHLLPAFTAHENATMPMYAARGRLDDAMRARGLALLDRVGLAGYAKRKATELSGGQQQRVAIARALAQNPPLVLADEPTGNLDTRSADQVFELLRDFNRTQRTTFLVVTHDPRLAARCDRVIDLVDGKVRSDSRKT